MYIELHPISEIITENGASGDVTGPGTEVDLVRRISIAVDDPLAGVDRRSALGVDHPELPRVAARILVGDPFHHFRWSQPLLEQRDRLWSVLPIRRRLRGDCADAGLGERNRRAGGKGARLDGDAELVCRRIEGNDREGREPRIRLRR